MASKWKSSYDSGRKYNKTWESQFGYPKHWIEARIDFVSCINGTKAITFYETREERKTCAAYRISEVNEEN